MESKKRGPVALIVAAFAGIGAFIAGEARLAKIPIFGKLFRSEQTIVKGIQSAERVASPAPKIDLRSFPQPKANLKSVVPAHLPQSPPPSAREMEASLAKIPLHRLWQLRSKAPEISAKMSRLQVRVPAYAYKAIYDRWQRHQNELNATSHPTQTDIAALEAEQAAIDAEIDSLARQYG